jgi:iron complex outermembrane receptor protein
MRVPTIALMLALVSWSGLAAHETHELFDISLEELADVRVVSASKYPQKLLESPSAISIVSHEDIHHSPAQSVPELLQYVVGMDGYTKTHTDMDVAARGFAYDETPKMLVLIDGQAVNVVPYGGMQWPTLPITLDDIERIEVVRGSASSIYGADALVGVINIITHEAHARPNEISLSYGERGMGQYRIQLAKSLSQNWSGAITTGFLQTEEKGDLEIPEASAVAPNYGLKDWANVYLGAFRFDYAGKQIAFSSLGGYSADQEGYNPSPGDNSIDKSEKKTFYVTNQLSTEVGPDQMMLKLGYRTLRQQNHKWNDDDYAFKYKIKKGDAFDFEAQYIFQRLENSTFIGGVSASYFEASRDIANTPPYLYDEDDRLLSAYAQEELRLFDRRLALTLGARFDNWETLDGVFSPKAAVNVWLVRSLMNLRLSAGSSFRRPSFDENFYLVTWPGGWFKGAGVDAVTESGRTIEGELLEPEHLVAYEAGLRLTPDQSTLIDIEAFQHKVRDIIGYTVFEAGPDTLNLGFTNTGDHLTVAGLEVELKRQLSTEISAFLNYTLQRATIEYEGGAEDDWANAPQHKASGGIRYLGFLNADLRFRFVDDLAYQEVPSVPVNSYWTVDMAMSKRFPHGVYTKVGVLNLLDDEHYEYPIYTVMKRRAYLTFEYGF